MAKRNALGKGLGAIFSDLVDDGSDKTRYHLCGVDELRPNSFQPRRSFGKEELARLADSIRSSGVIQPVVVRKADRGYEIIAGERRWRAAQEAGLSEVPVIIRDASDRDVAEWSLIENLQREALNPVEEADAYQQLISQFQLTQDDIARQVGKDRSTIANALRLLKLPSRIRDALVEETITAGHARTLLALESAADQLALFEEITARRLSVRETERRVRQVLETETKTTKRDRRDPELQNLETLLSRKLLTRVTIRQKKRGGALEIRYLSQDELKRIIDLMMVS